MEGWLSRLIPLGGLAVLVGLCLLLSNNRPAALRRWDLILWAFGLQFVFALFVLKTGPGEWIFDRVNEIFVALINCTQAGSEFVFGPLATPYGPGNVATVGLVDAAVDGDPVAGLHGPILGFYVLSVIVFFAALTSVLYHLHILQTIVGGIAWVMRKTMGTSGAETLCAAGNIFVGQTESPLLVRPYLARMTQSELMTVMTGGFATVAGSVMAVYITILSPSIPDIGGHLLAASIMSAPAALLFGKLMIPETGEPETAGDTHVEVERESANLIDAITLGTTEGLRLALNVGAMLLAFLALIALIDLLLGSVAGLFVEEVPGWLTLRGLIGVAFVPFAWLLGIVDPAEAWEVGKLLGVKMAANEFVAYLDLAAASEALSERTRIIAAYALCGFANFGSIGIQIGGLAVMAPERRQDLSRLALRAMLAGTFAANATACIAAILI